MTTQFAKACAPPTARERMTALTRPAGINGSAEFRRLMALKYSPRELEIAGIDDGGLLTALIGKESQK